MDQGSCTSKNGQHYGYNFMSPTFSLLIYKLFLYTVTDVYEKNPFKRVEQTFFFPVLHDQNISVQIIADYLTHMFLNQIYLSIHYNYKKKHILIINIYILFHATVSIFHLD